jgi:hypothetical protein
MIEKAGFAGNSTKVESSIPAAQARPDSYFDISETLPFTGISLRLPKIEAPHRFSL